MGAPTATEEAETAEKEERGTRRESRSKESTGTRSGSRERRTRSKSADRQSTSSSSRSRRGTRTHKPGERSKSRERSRPKSHADDDNDDDNASLVRRRRKTGEEKAKAKTGTGSYLNGRKQEKDIIKGRKSSVMGSLHAFLHLEEGAEAPAMSTDARSVASSASRIRRRKSTATATSASVVGGVVSSREEMKASRRRAKDSTHRQRSHSEGPLERSRSNRRSMMEQSKSGSYKNARRNAGSPKPNREEERNPHPTPTTTSDNPIQIRQVQQRRSSMIASTGAEVPPGFPAAAVNSVSVSHHDNLATSERSTSPVPSGIAESTAQIRERQQQRSSLTGGGRDKSLSALDPDVDHFRKARRRSSMDNTGTSTCAGASTGTGTGTGTTPNTSQSTDSNITLEPAPPPPQTAMSLRRKPRNHSSNAALDDGAGGPSTPGKSRQNRKRISSTPEGDETSAMLGAKVAVVTDAKGSKKPSKIESRSVASAPAHSNKHSSSSKRRSKQNSEGKSLTRKESRSKLTSGDRKTPLESLSEMKPSALPAREHSNAIPKKENMEDLMNCSMASLDPNLLNRTTAPISSIVELYSEDNEVENNGNSGSIGLGEKFRDQYGHPQDYNQSTISFDSTQLQNAAAAFGGTTAFFRGTGSGASTPKSGSDGEGLISPGCLRRKIGQVAAVSPRIMDKRVSWVELPLHNPEALVLKSTSTDGTNETVTTTTHDAVPDMPNNDEEGDDSDQEIESSAFSLKGESEGSVDGTKKIGETEKSSVSTKSMQSKSRRKSTGGSDATKKGVSLDKDGTPAKPTQSKPNRSLDEALKREDEMVSKDHMDERTVATSATGNTNASEKTVKTANRSTSPHDAKPTLSKGADTNDYQDSISADDLADDLPLVKDGSSTSLRSAGSNSSSSLGRRRGKDESSGTPEKRKSGSSQRKSRSRGDSKESSRPKEGGSREHRRSKLSKERSRSNVSGESKRKPKPNGSDRSLSSEDGTRKPGETIKFRPSAEIQPSGEPTQESSDENDAKPKLKVNAAIGSEDGTRVRRKRSYLPRNTAKGDKYNSKEQRDSIKSSLDKFLEKMDDTGPIIKDDNRSVYSAIQDNDRKKRIRDRKREELGTTRIRRIPRQNSRTTARGVERQASDDDDNVSVSSAPMFSSRQARKRLEEQTRPVVNLKETNFSTKLHKLHVAF
jgi:hypothetical protein